MSRGLVTERGKRAFVYWLAQHVTHGAVGAGDWPDKFNPPLEDYDGDGLVAEIGRVPILAVRYLVRDPAGTIVFDGDPTTYRYATQTEIDAAAADPDGATAPSADIEFEFEIPANTINGTIICEIGLFTDSVCSVPGFAVPAQVTTAGQPFYLVNIPADSMYANKVFNRRVRIDGTN
jgi:hypothetical protein